MKEKFLAHPVKAKDRVPLHAKKSQAYVPPKAAPRVGESSKGLVSHIYNEWSCKNFDV